MFKELEEFLDKYEKINKYEMTCLPLCAAENISSDFVKLPQSTFLQEKYILGGVLEYTKANNFLGSENLYTIYEHILRQCNKQFKCQYADARTLSGINAVTTLLMALFKIGDTIYVTSPEYGGHSSMPLICERLGLNIEYLPYDYSIHDFDYEKINSNLSTDKFAGILIALSDMIEQPNLYQLKLNNTILLYDATQILGLIASGYITNPFQWFNNEDNVIVLGATHKTIAGPTCGLILTNNLKLANKIDLQINPNYLRNNQLNNIVSLLFALYEIEYFGKDYFNVMKDLIEITSKELENLNLKVLKTRKCNCSDTHQLWLILTSQQLDRLEKNAKIYGVSLNVRCRKIYHNYGVRLGFQQVAHFNWPKETGIILAQIIKELTKKNCNKKKVEALMQKLPDKKIYFTFDNQTIKETFEKLHNS